MLLENIRDKKLTELYEVLTKSDFKGNVEDEYALSLMYVMMCLDRIVKRYGTLDRNDYVLYAKEIVRIADEDDDERISYMSYTDALVSCMKKEDLSYKDVHRMNLFDLVKKVKAYLQ